MRRATRFLVGLFAGLALLAVLSYYSIAHTITHWFEADLKLRSQLAIGTARATLESDWGTARLGATLADIARDKRIMGALACSPGGAPLFATDGYPREYPCPALLEWMRARPAEPGELWTMTTALPTGPIHLSLAHVGARDAPLGTIALAHDLRFLTDRVGTARNSLIIAFFVMALCASAVTLIALRLAWRHWTRDLRLALAATPAPSASGQGPSTFGSLLQDVHSLAERIASERERDTPGVTGGIWSPDRLRATLTEHLQGERVVILANREPYIHERGPEGIRVVHPASGLVTALEPVMRACSGVWVAHGAGSADRETVDGHDRVLVPPGEESYMVRRVWLSEAEENGYYYGFSNEGLWPLCHVAHARPVFRAEDYEQYIRVNQKFADAVCEEVDSDDPIVLVQDYHFSLAPAMIRKRLPRATIITFWHIPWPNVERVGICPWREELISGLLGSSVVGFHTQQHCNNFIEAVDVFMESRIDREDAAVYQGPHRTLIRPYPISIEWPVHWLEDIPPASEVRGTVREALGLPEDTWLGVGVDRLDYTKGIEERLLAVDELLTHHPEFRGKFTFVQLAAPSRTKIARYQELNERVEAVAREINGKWSTESYRPIILLRSHHEPQAVFRYYRAADLCYVSSLHDGMNLVAKEFVAARDDEQGVLILSQFTGAARDLTEALIVNPYDLRQASDAMAAALRMSAEEQRARMQSMRKLVSEFNVCRWAGRMLVDAAELRRKERMSERFVSTTQRAENA